MPVTEQTPINTSTGNGVTTVFPYTFKILQSSDMMVLADGVDVVGGYTVSGVGNDAGGNVTFSTAPANGVQIVRKRDMAYARSTDYQANGDLLADTLDDDQDAPVMMIQQLSEEVGRAFSVPPGSTPPTIPDTLTPDRYWRNNATGDGVDFVDLTVGTDSVALAAALAASTGSSLMGHIASGTGAVARTVRDKLRESVSVMDFGAVGNGVADDTAAIQAAIDYVENNGGGRVYLPANVYKLNSGVTISRGGVTLYGDGNEEFAGAFGATVPQVRGHGTWIYWDFLSTSPITLSTSTSNGVNISKIGFDCPKPTIASGWSPTNHGPAISVLSGPCVLEDLYFFGVSRGIQIGAVGAASGRATLSRIKGEFFVFGVDITFSADVVRINGYHQYPFWSIFATGPVRDYQSANTYGIRSGRNDNAQFSNVFIGGVYRGLYVYSTTDGTTNELMVSNMDCDFTDTGYIFDTDFATASFVNIGSQPGPDATLANSASFFVAGNQNRIRIANFRSARTNKESIQIGGTNNVIGVVNYDVNNWDDQQSGLAGAIRSDSATNTITLAGSVYYAHADPSLAGPLLTGSLASYKWIDFATKVENLTTDGSGDATVTHNLGFTPNAVDIQLKTLFGFVMIPHTITSTTFKVRVINTTNGLPATASSVQFNWSASM